MRPLFAASIVALGLAACVPAADDPPPRGAAGFAISPSAATRGVPFVTRDGYTVTIERLVVRLLVNASTGASDDATLLSLAAPAEVYATAIAEGPTNATLFFGARSPYTDSERDVRLGVSAAEDARFSALPDLLEEFGGPRYEDPRPAVLLVARAERGAEVYRIDATFFEGSSSSRAPLPLVVRRNALTTAPISANAEGLFTVGGAEPRALFASFAAADRNRDGVLDPTELAAAHPSEEEANDRSAAIGDEASLVDLLVSRARVSLLR